MLTTYPKTRFIPSNSLGERLQKEVETSPITNYLHSLNSSRSRKNIYDALYAIEQDASDLLPQHPSGESLKEAGIHRHDVIYFVAWHQLAYSDAVAIQKRLAVKRKPQIVNQYMGILKGVLRQAQHIGLVSGEIVRRIDMIRSFRFEQHEAGRYVQDNELIQLVNQLLQQKQTTDLRTAVTICLAYTCGLRIAEIESLHYADYDPGTGYLRVNGKGSKPRTVFVLNKTHILMERWLAVRGHKPGPLFPGRGGKSLSATMIGFALRQALQRSDLAHFTFHDLRRKFASDLISKGVDAITVAKLMGHTEVETTLRYDRSQSQRAQSSIDRRQLPVSIPAAPWPVGNVKQEAT